MVSFLRFLARKRKMPGFPTRIVGILTIRGKARRYKSKNARLRRRPLQRGREGEEAVASAKIVETFARPANPPGMQEANLNVGTSGERQEMARGERRVDGVRRGVGRGAQSGMAVPQMKEKTAR